MPYQGGGGYGSGGGMGYGGGRGGGYGGGGGGGQRRGRYNDNAEVDPNGEQFRKLFVGGLSYDTTENGLKEHFEKWGEIVDCVVMRDPATKRSRGFGFITYKEASQIDEAQKNRVHKIDNREVETKRAMPRDSSGNNASNQQSVNKMFVGGLKDDTTEDMVREVFAEYGEIEQVEIVTDKATGKVRGFCFVTYNDYDPVDKAVLKKKHELNGRKVEVKKAVSRDQLDGGGRGGAGGRGGGRERGFFNGQGYGGGGGGGGGGYGGGGYGGSGGYGPGGGGGYGGQGWSGSGGFGDYNNSWGGGGGGGGFGSNYGNEYSGGAMKGGGYSARGPGPYGGGYGSGGGGYSGGGGGGFRR